MGIADNFFYAMYWNECWEEAAKQMRAEREAVQNWSSEEVRNMKLEVLDSAILREMGILGVTAESRNHDPGTVIVRGEIDPCKLNRQSKAFSYAKLTSTVYNSDHEVIGTHSEVLSGNQTVDRLPFEVYVTCSESHGGPHSVRLCGGFS